MGLQSIKDSSTPDAELIVSAVQKIYSFWNEHGGKYTEMKTRATGKPLEDLTEDEVNSVHGGGLSTQDKRDAKVSLRAIAKIINTVLFNLFMHSSNY